MSKMQCNVAGHDGNCNCRARQSRNQNGVKRDCRKDAEYAEIFSRLRPDEQPLSTGFPQYLVKKPVGRPPIRKSIIVCIKVINSVPSEVFFRDVVF
jgi:hypothetical protein